MVTKWVQSLKNVFQLWLTKDVHSRLQVYIVCLSSECNSSDWYQSHVWVIIWCFNFNQLFGRCTYWTYQKDQYWTYQIKKKTGLVKKNIGLIRKEQFHKNMYLRMSYLNKLQGLANYSFTKDDIWSAQVLHRIITVPRCITNRHWFEEWKNIEQCFIIQTFSVCIKFFQPNMIVNPKFHGWKQWSVSKEVDCWVFCETRPLNLMFFYKGPLP